MMYPPSLPDDVKGRAFLADNGEIGVLPADTIAFLDACRADTVEVFGWELWVVDHVWGLDNSPAAAEGCWCGGIPLRGGDFPAVVCGDGGVDETAGQIAAFDFAAEVQTDWLPYVRVNFTLAM